MSSSVTQVQPLNDTELGAWRGLLRAHAMLVKRLDAELDAAHGLPLTSYEVLLHLADAPEQKMRMCDIADSVLLSRSGLTRLIDRLERDGYVARVSCADDARGAFAQLTEEGLTKLHEARATHLDGVREHFLRHFAGPELELLGDAWSRVTGGASHDGPACAPS